MIKQFQWQACAAMPRLYFDYFCTEKEMLQEHT